jgi:hypothetical protein
MYLFGESSVIGSTPFSWLVMQVLILYPPISAHSTRVVDSEKLNNLLVNTVKVQVILLPLGMITK